MTENKEVLDGIEQNFETQKQPSEAPEQAYTTSINRRLFMLMGVLSVIALLVVFYILKLPVTTDMAMEEVKNIATSTPEVAFEIDPNTKAVWFDTPSIMSDQNFVTSSDTSYYSNSLFYQIGTYGDAAIVLQHFDEVFALYNLVFLVKDENVKLLLNHTSKSSLNDFSFSPKVKLDNKIKFEELSPANEIFIGNKKIVRDDWGDRAESGYEYYIFNTGLLNTKEVVGLTPQGEIVRIYNLTKDGTIMGYGYIIDLVGGLALSYSEPLPEYVTDDRVLQVTWSDTHEKNTELYRFDGLGSCGGGGPEIAVNKVEPADMRLVGKTITGENAYVITNPEHLFIERVFAVTKGVVYEYNEESGVTEEKTITREEFIAAKGVVVIESNDGTQTIFTHGKYGPQAECGKPVIYLYPESVTDVTVKVDAYVTKSDPVYDQNDGWKAVANPDGTLIVNGAEYESLFWDGYGNGAYNKPETGVIVPTETALEVMANNLRTIGFIDNEIKDFVEFWSDYMPEEDYTRITWLLNGEMEELAHLSIEPRPDTLIRAFVDYEGVDVPYEITPQNLPTIERRGYVATEWGGLLRKN